MRTNTGGFTQCALTKKHTFYIKKIFEAVDRKRKNNTYLTSEVSKRRRCIALYIYIICNRPQTIKKYSLSFFSPFFSFTPVSSHRGLRWRSNVMNKSEVTIMRWAKKDTCKRGQPEWGGRIVSGYHRRPTTCNKFGT